MIEGKVLFDVYKKQGKIEYSIEIYWNNTRIGTIFFKKDREKALNWFKYECSNNPIKEKMFKLKINDTVEERFEEYLN